MKIKKTLIKILSLLLVVLVLIAALLFTGVIKLSNSNIEEEPVINEAEIVEEIKNVQSQRETWLNNKSINNDYIGEIIFDSNLVNQPFVQAKDVYDKQNNLYHFYTEDGRLVTNPEGYTGNDVYIWTNWRDMSYDYNILGGSVFMDYRNSLDDQNIIIYGHHFSVGGGNDPKREKAFTPIEKLLEESNYSDNKTLKLVLDNETRSYELACVYEFNAYDDEHLEKLQYYRTEYNYDEFSDVYDETYYDSYIEMLEKVKLYDTDLKLTNEDKTLTLQTCIGGHAGELFEICVFKLIDIEYFED